MNSEILFIGLDVDDIAYHGYAIAEKSEFNAEFKCKPTLAALNKKLIQFTERGYQLRICYEATYVGFSLQRSLAKSGYSCDVIAPSLIPTTPGDKIKTDRLDSKKLATYFKNGLLTKIHIPDVDQEAVRDLIRSRKKISEHQKSIKNAINALCRRLGRNYRQELGQKNASFWTIKHFEWLEKLAKDSSSSSLKFNINMQLVFLRQTQNVIETYDLEIQKISQSDTYDKSVKAIVCYRGIDILTAMSIIIELGDINRFAHPKQIASYAGMDLKERSSGANRMQTSMTKAGNRFLRTNVIEACQQAALPIRIGPHLRRRRIGIDPKLIEIADRCMKRLHKKSLRLIFNQKPINKVKTACARELLCFIWESLKQSQKVI